MKFWKWHFRQHGRRYSASQTNKYMHVYGWLTQPLILMIVDMSPFKRNQLLWKWFFQHKRHVVAKLVVWVREWQNWFSQICQRCREIHKKGQDNETDSDNLFKNLYMLDLNTIETWDFVDSLITWSPGQLVGLGGTMHIYSYGHFFEDTLSPNSIVPVFTRFTLDNDVS